MITNLVIMLLYFLSAGMRREIEEIYRINQNLKFLNQYS